MVGGLDLSKGIEGMLTPNPDGSGEWGIIYNETVRSPGRRNFTLAHELGHYLLHRQLHPQGLQCTNRNMADWDEARNKIEAEANTFASYLLMPLNPVTWPRGPHASSDARKRRNAATPLPYTAPSLGRWGMHPGR